MTKDVIDVLSRAKSKIQQGWTQGEFARDASGKFVSSEDADATCWCVYGAVSAAMAVPFDNPDIYEEVNTLWFRTETRLEYEAGGQNLASWNDEPGRTKEQVLALFDRAIEKAEAQNV